MNQQRLTPGVTIRLQDLLALRARSRGISFLPRQPVTSILAGQHASRLRGRGLNFEELRRYIPGDDPRTIDWKVTARTRKVHSRVFTEERERPVLLVIDQRMSMFFGSRSKLKAVVAAEAAALAAWRTLADQDRIGAIVFGDRERSVIRPQRSPAAVMAILKAIVDRNQSLHAQAAPSDPSQLNLALRQVNALATHDYLVVLITDAHGANDESKRLATEISQHNDVLMVFVYDPLEVDFAARPRAIVSDGRAQLEVPSEVSRIRNAFQQDFQSRLTAAKKFLLTRQVPVLMLDTQDDVATQISRQLGGRPGRPS
jgi:uncharacterized protein (DUF58 family)